MVVVQSHEQLSTQAIKDRHYIYIRLLSSVTMYEDTLEEWLSGYIGWDNAEKGVQPMN